MSSPDDGRHVLLAGTTGLVGRELLNALLHDERTALVHALLRRAVLDLPGSRRLSTHYVDFAALPELPRLDEAYIALGTTIGVAGSQAAFRAVDFDAVLATARAARAAGATRLALVSALGADARSSVFYNRVKGEAEAAVAGLGFERLVIARPSLLAGKRRALDQPARLGESVTLALLRPIAFALPAAVRPISARRVARAMVRALRADEPLPSPWLTSKAMQVLGA